ncbi:MAG: hypothetical protein K2X54_31800 [Methylobacterium organophilum]|nr:hypothetical protein [Methylobacterium organophilum]
MDFWPLTKEGFASILEDPSHGVADNMLHCMYKNNVGYRSSMIKIGHLAAIFTSIGADREVRQKFFGDNSSWLIVRRRNLIRQAISLAYASRSGLYHYYGDADQAEDRNINISPADVMPHFKSIVASDAYLNVLERRLARHHTVFYEDFVEDPEFHVREIMRNLSLPGDLGQLVLGKPKLIPTAQDEKRMMELEFEELLLSGY